MSQNNILKVFQLRKPTIDEALKCTASLLFVGITSYYLYQYLS